LIKLNIFATEPHIFFMKTSLLFLFLGISFSIHAQSSIQTFIINCDEITTTESSDAVKNHLLENYPGKIFSYQEDLNKHTASIQCSIEAVDVLQLYRQLGYNAIYLLDSKRYSLTPDGSRMRIIKE
jgi:hypothetical protein